MRARELRVAAHLRPLVLVELAGLVEDQAGDAELADVVQQARRGAGRARSRGPKPSASRDRDGDARDAVASGAPVYGDFASMTRANASATRSRRVVVGDDARGRSGSSGGEHGVRRRSPPSALPEARVALAARTSVRHERGVEPGPARARGHVERGSRAAGGQNDLDGLGEADDAGQQRDRLAGEAARGCRRRPSARRARGSPSTPRSSSSTMRAMSAPRSQRRSVSSRALEAPLRSSPAKRLARASRPAARRGVADRVAERRRSACGGRCRELVLALTAWSSARRARRPGRALLEQPAVLEQQRVEEREALRLAQPELVRDPHADHAGARGVAGGLPLGDVQRERERADELGQAEILHADQVIGRNGRRCTGDVLLVDALLSRAAPRERQRGVRKRLEVRDVLAQDRRRAGALHHRAVARDDVLRLLDQRLAGAAASRRTRRASPSRRASGSRPARGSRPRRGPAPTGSRSPCRRRCAPRSGAAPARRRRPRDARAPAAPGPGRATAATCARRSARRRTRAARAGPPRARRSAARRWSPRSRAPRRGTRGGRAGDPSRRA